MNANIYKTYKINAFIKKHLNSSIYKKKVRPLSSGLYPGYEKLI